MFFPWTLDVRRVLTGEIARVSECIIDFLLDLDHSHLIHDFISVLLDLDLLDISHRVLVVECCKYCPEELLLSKVFSLISGR